jgi:putative inorganic carbon (HCO3(-)) transporter
LSISTLVSRAGFWVLCAGAFLSPLVYSWNTYDRFVLPKLLFAGFLAVLLAALLAIRWAADGAIAIKRTPLDLPLLAFLGSAVISSVFAINRNIAVFGMYFRYEGLITLALYALLFWLAAQALSDAAQARTLVRILLASAYLVALVAVIQSLTANLTTTPGSDTAFNYGGLLRAYATFGNPNFLAVFLAMLLPRAMDELIDAKAASSRILAVNLLVMLSLALVLTFSRSAWLAAAVGLLGVLVGRRPPRRVMLALAGAVVGLALVIGVLAAASTQGGLPLAHTVLGRALSIHESQGSGITRLHVWDGTVRLVASRPLVGYGPDTFGIVYPRFRTGDWAPGLVIDKAHADVLQVAATQGLIGVAAYLWIVLALAVAFWQGRHRAGAVAAFAGVIVYLAWAQLNFSFVPAAVPFWIFAGAAVTTWAGRLPAVHLVSIQSRLAFPVGGLAAVALVGFGLFGLVRAYIADVDFSRSATAQAVGDRGRAQTTITRARRLVPDQSLYAAEAGSIALDLDGNGRPGPDAAWSAAHEAYAAAVRLGTYSPRLYYYLALADQALGKREDAIRAIREGLQLSPGDPVMRALFTQLSAHNPP